MHIVGGLHHQMKYDWYVNIIRLLHETYPELHLKAWTPVEIDWFCRLAKKSVREVLEDMVDAGLGSLPGGGAEIFHPEVRNQICEHKADAYRWFETHRTAHELGLRSNCTMLYGHIEQPYHRIDHLIRLRELQDETGGFQTFIPLAFHPDNTGLSHIKKPTSLMDLRVMAVSRLMLDNVPHIKAYWIMLGIGTAQVALSYGADDIDGTVRHELIYHDAGATTPEVLSVDAIRRLIVEAGREPVERDTLYHRIERDGTRWQAGAAITAGA
jgi:aminodeoxyfutalosine synthase